MGNTCTKAFLLIKLPEAWDFIKKETLAQVFSVNFAKFLRTPFSQDILRVTALDILMQITIYNVNLSLQFVTINFTFSLL